VCHGSCWLYEYQLIHLLALFETHGQLSHDLFSDLRIVV